MVGDCLRRWNANVLRLYELSAREGALRKGSGSRRGEDGLRRDNGWKNEGSNEKAGQSKKFVEVKHFDTCGRYVAV